MKINLKLLAQPFVILSFLASQIYSSKALEKATPIIVQSDDKKMAIKVNLDQSLSDLRSELIKKGGIKPDNIFQWEGSDVFRNDEKNWIVRDIIKDNTLFLKTGKANLHIPLVAQGHEEIYQRFLNGYLIYRPTPNSDEGEIILPIADLANPLEGTFDLSQCSDGQYLSISTGYRKEKKKENENKIEIWFTPRFLIEREINATAKHFQVIFPAQWNADAPVGIFWTWGGWDDFSSMFYLTTQNMDELSTNNLYKKWGETRITPHKPGGSSMGFIGDKFHICW